MLKLGAGHGIPLDYIMVLPYYLKQKAPNKDHAEIQRVENTVKNVVMRMLAKIRVAK